MFIHSKSPTKIILDVLFKCDVERIRNKSPTYFLKEAISKPQIHNNEYYNVSC